MRITVHFNSQLEFWAVKINNIYAEPSLSLTTAGAIGAVIGTVLLPGIGTSLGLQAGGRLEGKVECK